MATMLIDNHKQTVMDLLREGEDLLQRIGDQENAQKLEAAHREASNKKSPTINLNSHKEVFSVWRKRRNGEGHAVFSFARDTGISPTKLY